MRYPAGTAAGDLERAHEAAHGLGHALVTAFLALPGLRRLLCWLLDVR